MIGGADPGDDDERRLLVLTGNVLEHVESGKIREHQIDEGQIRMVGIVAVQALGAGVGQDDLMPLVAQELAEHFEKVLFVVNDEDAGGQGVHDLTSLVEWLFLDK